MDKEKISSNFSKSAKHYDKYADLQLSVAKKLFALLKDRQDLAKILDVGCGTGALVEMLLNEYPRSEIFGVDIAEGMVEVASKKIKGEKVRFLRADAEHLPFKLQEFDLVVSSLSLQWMDAQGIFEQVSRVLKQGGDFYFSTFGPATLEELKRNNLSINFFPHIDWLKTKLSVYFKQIAYRKEKVVKHYQDPFELFAFLKNIGAQYPAKKLNKGLMTRKKIDSLGSPDITYEVYYFACSK
jgi:malonyl-CoA O-methyltransferase